MPQTTSITTAEQLLAAGDIGRCELIRGELQMMTPAGWDHGGIANDLAFHVTAHVKKHRLGRVSTAETGFYLSRNPDTVRAPDVGFVSAARLPRGSRPGYFNGAPDLAAEVLSPHDSASYILDKVEEWLTAGTRIVWVVDPKTRTVTVYQRGSNQSTKLGVGDRLTGGDVLPGFDLQVGDLFLDD